MNSIFDLQKLSALLRDFYQLSHIRTTVFDESLRELVSYPETLPPICRMIRSTSRGLDECLRCDQAACKEALRRKATHIYTCHAGLTEAVTPLFVDEVPVGYLYFGNVFSYPTMEEGMASVKSRCLPLDLPEEALEDALRLSPLIQSATVSSATQILNAVASYLILERMASLREDRLAVRLNAHISAHFTEALTAPDICRALKIGKTQLYALANQLYGCGISAQIRNLRMELARELLREPSNPLTEIAAQCGYTDYNYFIAVFTREIGCPPGAYRKKVTEA